MKRFIFLILVLLIQFSVALAVPDSRLYFEPQNLSVNPGSNFSLTLKINPGTNRVSAVELYLSFDKTRLQLNNLTASTAFPTVLKSATIDGTTGTASITLGSPPDSPVTTIAEVVTLDFSVKSNASAGNAGVAVVNTSKAAAVGETGNVIVSSGYGSATVAVVVPSPSPSPVFNRADLDQNGRVWLEDYNILVSVFGQTNPVPGWIRADIDKNGKIDIYDYNILVTEFGKTL